MALTASADLQSRAIVTRQLHMDNATVLSVSPNRVNIRLGLHQISNDSLDCLDWVVKDVKERGAEMLPVLIYCRTVNMVARIFCHLKAELGDKAWVAGEQIGDNLLIGMFHSETLPANKSRVLAALTGEGNCRVVVATSALGVGLNFSHISHVIMYGIPEDTEAMLQQIGRAGRDGSQAHAVVYTTKNNKHTDATVRRVIGDSKTSCFRMALYSHFEKGVTSAEPGHSCCTYCHSICKCISVGCPVSVPVYEFPEQMSTQSPLKFRDVTSHNQTMVRELLHQYRQSLVQDHTRLYTSITACTGFSVALIDSVVDHLSHIFDLTYVLQNLPVFRKEHGQEILRIVHTVFGDFELTETTVTHVQPVMPDVDFTGYFDSEDDEPEHMLKSSSSAESGFSVLRSSD